MPGFYPLALLLSRMGMRGGEALTLQVSDLDFERRGIWVRRTWGSRRSSLGELRINTPKSGNERFIDMSRHLTDVLQDYLQSREDASVWLFPSPRKGPMHPRVFLHRWKALMKLSGLVYKTPHTLRHTYATLLLQNGESPTYVKEQLGHSSIKVTVDTYGHFIPGANRAAVDKLDEICNLLATNLRGGEGHPSPSDYVKAAWPA